MAEILRTRFQLRRGYEAAWEKNNPILAAGEPGFVLDKNLLKIGDGVTRWKDLPYINNGSEVFDEQVQQIIADLEILEQLVINKADKSTTLAGYGINDAYTKTETDEALLLKVSKLEYEAKVSEIDAELLSKANVVDVYKKDETYNREEIAKLIADVTGGESAAEALAALEAYKTSNNARVESLELIVNGREAVEGTEKIIGLVEKVAKLESVNALKIEAIKIGETSLDVKDGIVVLPLALSTQAGLVKSSDAENAISVTENGIMMVNSVNVNKLVQTTGDWIILNGGASK